MRLPRVRITVRRMMIAVAIAGAAVAAGRLLSFNRWAHQHRDAAGECGCVRPDLSRLSWPERCLTAYHSGMAALFSLCADVYVQPPLRCGIPIFDPVPGDSSP